MGEARLFSTRLFLERQVCSGSISPGGVGFYQVRQVRLSEECSRLLGLGVVNSGRSGDVRSGEARRG